MKTTNDNTIWSNHNVNRQIEQDEVGFLKGDPELAQLYEEGTKELLSQLEASPAFDAGSVAEAVGRGAEGGVEGYGGSGAQRPDLAIHAAVYRLKIRDPRTSEATPI